MNLYELLVLMGVDPKVEPWRAIIWFSSVMIVGVLVFLGATLAWGYSGGNSLWYLVLIPYYIGAYISGHIFNIFDTSKNRSGLKDMGRFFVEMTLLGVDRDQSFEKFAAWRAGGIILAIVFSYLFFRQLIGGGSQWWGLTIFPLMLVYYLIGRRFGHFR